MNEVLNAKNVKKVIMKDDIEAAKKRLIYHSYAEQTDRDILKTHQLFLINPNWGAGWGEIGEDILTYLEIDNLQYHCETDWNQKDYYMLDQIFKKEKKGARIVCGWDDKLEEIFNRILIWSVEKWATYWNVSVEDARKYLLVKLNVIDTLLDYKWSNEARNQGSHLNLLLKHEYE